MAAACAVRPDYRYPPPQRLVDNAKHDVQRQDRLARSR